MRKKILAVIVGVFFFYSQVLPAVQTAVENLKAKGERHVVIE